MNVQLQKPEFESYVNEQVRAGNFPNPEAVIEDALARVMMGVQGDLTDEDMAAIQEADEEFARGEGVDEEEAQRRVRSLYRKAK